MLDKRAGASAFLTECSIEKGSTGKINYFQKQHHLKQRYAEEYDFLLSSTGWNGALRKTIEMVAGQM
jgi:hypothetical protein